MTDVVNDVIRLSEGVTSLKADVREYYSELGNDLYNAVANVDAELDALVDCLRATSIQVSCVWLC